MRDLLSWVSFIDSTERKLGPEYAFLHGAFLVLLDGLSLGNSCSVTMLSIYRKISFISLMIFLGIVMLMHGSREYDLNYLTSVLYNHTSVFV